MKFHLVHRSSSRQKQASPNTNNSSLSPPTDYTHLVQKYEEFMLRRLLVTISDTRWCPAPDCTYAVIATGCANCPQLFCMRPGCGTSFCYHCKQRWHANLTCEDAAFRAILINSSNEAAAAATTPAATISATSASTTTNKLIRSLLQRSNSHLSSSSSVLNLATSSSAAASLGYINLFIILKFKYTC